MMQSAMKQTIRVAKLTMQETGTYNPVHQRPYMTHVSGDTMNAIGNRLQQVGNGNITGNLLGGIASTIMAPSATPGDVIHIPYGLRNASGLFWKSTQCLTRVVCVCTTSKGLQTPWV
jgi:hypothetical protein